MPQAQQLGRYQLLDRIAFGGMAEIYRAKTFDASGRARLVAVKRVLQHLTQDEDFIRMLVDEAKITAILDHPSIARVFEFSQDGGEYFIAMEYCDGKDARSILEKHRQKREPIAPEHVAWIIASVAEGLHAAHTQTDVDGRPMFIVHRDVSPSNILCAYSGDIKLCDFGIAKATLTRVQTRTGVIKGKVKYMSPEQAMGRKLDGRSDLFSLGTVMYEMLTLEAPFQAQTEVELIFAVRDARKRDARDVVPSLPPPLNDIVNRTMQRQRSDRFQTGRELARELRGWLERAHPGYKRGSFNRFMRTLFKDEIEKELRQLEGWVIEPGDASKVGVNLIADALPADAPYRNFSAASSHGLPGDGESKSSELPAQKTNIYQRADLHAQSTQILGRDAVAEVHARVDLHERETMMLKGREADKLRSLIEKVQAESVIVEPQTQIFRDAPAGAPPPAELPALKTRILSRDDSLARPAKPPPIPSDKGRGKHDTSPDEGPRRFEDDPEESTAPQRRAVKPDFDPRDSANDTDPRRRGRR